jgi:DNA-binding transcriptional MerR regulator
MAASTDAAGLTIDQLAQRTGMTVRNIRAHQSRGLLPPPEVRGRTGFYGAEHVARVELIKDLQAEGFNLELIGRLLEMAGGSSEEALRFTRVLREPFGEEEESQILDLGDLEERFGTLNPLLLRKAEKLGLLRPFGDGRYEDLHPRLTAAGTELVRMGIPIERSLEIVEKLRRHADAVSKAFAQLFLDSVWKPFEAAGHPEEGWPEVSEKLERIRPLATESLVAIFQISMNQTVEEVMGRELYKRAQDERARGRKSGGGARKRAARALRQMQRP